MTLTIFISAILIVLIASLIYFKKELIRSYVEQMIKNKSQLYILAVVIVLILLIAIFSLFLPNEEVNENQEIVVIEEVHELTEAEQILEVTKESLVIVDELVQTRKENKAIKDSVFQLNREKKWVYKIGENLEKTKLINSVYEDGKNIGTLSVFKTSKGQYYLFVDGQESKEYLEESLSSIKSKVSNPNLSIKVIDLMLECKKKEHIAGTKRVKIGKEKVFLDCYTCSK